MDYIPLRMGAVGPAVRQVQRMLGHLGFPVGQADGKFGVQTLRAVIAFQSAFELPVDGIVAANTWMALERRAGGREEPEEEACPEPAPMPPEAPAPPMAPARPEPMIPPEPSMTEPPSPPALARPAPVELPAPPVAVALPEPFVVAPPPLEVPHVEVAMPMPPIQIVPLVDWKPMPPEPVRVAGQAMTEASVATLPQPPLAVPEPVPRRAWTKVVS